MKTTVNAKITIKGETRSFPLTIDWDGLKPDDERAMAQRTIVIAKQNRHRTANKGEGQWPTDSELNVKATDFLIGHRLQTPANAVTIVESGQLSLEQLKELEATIARVKSKMQKG